ncbi:C3a anaphylatoxin chemotactic receptor-like [Ranitomeya variabilis]|uniref:C3a anaphylatoxin chemotactic receptor-like n=1 Tax=Ranitomeya variabilis TaxID=490064 RepID=UPI004055AE95
MVRMNTDLLDTFLNSITPSYYDGYSELTATTYCSSCDDYAYIMQKMSITLYSVIFALGLIGNGLVIWIAGFRMKKTISAVWFSNLAIADFLCCASLPLRIADWVYFSPSISCKLSIILFNANTNASVLLLTVMSIDRWVSVMWPIWAKVHRTCKLVRIISGIIWLMSLVWTGFMFFSYDSHVYDFYEWCVNYSSDNTYTIDNKYKIQLVRLFIMCVIPFFIIFTSYVIIFFKLRKTRRSQRSQRSYKIISAVILCFFICWFPYYIWPITPWYYKSNIQFFIVSTIVLNLACLNSCVNPIIYVFMGQDFQHGFLRSIPSRLERALSEYPHDLCKNRRSLEHTSTTDD